MGDSNTVKKLIESLQTDLRNLSNEAKKKNPPVKEAAEAGMVKIRNISGGRGEENVIPRLRQASNEILHPFLMACSTRNPRLAQIGLTGIQRIVTHKIMTSTGANVIVNEIWSLMEAECEELKVLQTVALLVSTDKLVTSTVLARCLVMCFRLHFAKDTIVINTASASVRQLVGQVFERVIAEDSANQGPPGPGDSAPLKSHSKTPPKSLLPAAADAYMLFQDLCLLVNAEPPCWLVGITEMTRTLGLELLEAVLTHYHLIFGKHPEFVFLLKEQVCPLVIKLFSPNLKFIQVTSQHPHSRQETGLGPGQTPDRPYFPIAMRLLRVVSVLITQYYETLVTECEIFLSLIIKFLDGDKLLWQRALALEVLHKVTAKPELLKYFCESYDLKPHATKVLQEIITSLGGYVQTAFHHEENALMTGNSSGIDPEGPGSGQQMSSGSQPGFVYRGVWIPLCFISAQGASKSLYLELMDKHEPPALPDGYCLSLAYSSLVDATHSINQVVDKIPEPADSELCKQLLCSTHCGILAALSLLLDSSVDENVTEGLLKCLTILVGLACKLKEPGIRDACLGAVCKASLPPNYISRVVTSSAAESALFSYRASGSPRSHRKSDPGSESLSVSGSVGESVTGLAPTQVVAVGTPCPTPSLPPTALSTPVMLTAKNLQAMRSLISVCQLNGGTLQDSWHLVLGSLEHLVWILGLKPTTGGSLKSTQTGEGGSAGTVLTTAVMADIPVLGSMLSKLFEMTSTLDEVGLHHVIAALCKLSSEAMEVAAVQQREPSYFPVAKLLQTGLMNLHRLDVYWKPVTGHFIEICSHSYPKLREWGGVSITSLVKAAFSAPTLPNMELQKLHSLIMNPVLEMCEIGQEDIRQQQIDCLMQILRSKGQRLSQSLWPTSIAILGNVVSGRFCFGEALIKQSYAVVQLLTTDFLSNLSPSCLQQLVEVDAKFGAQQSELNISLSAVGQLWTISDFLYRNMSSISAKELDSLWLCLYTCLSDLCVDPRPPVRKSACHTLLQTVTSHGAVLKQDTWQNMVWQVLFPMLDKVKSLTCSASTTHISPGSMGGSNILIHHSRDTESKQWAETSVQTLAGVVKVFHAQRSMLLRLADFEKAWSSLLHYIEMSVISENSEISLAALRSFQELLQGRTVSSGDSTWKLKKPKAGTADPADTPENSIPVQPPLSEEHWMAAWKTWLRFSTGLATEGGRKRLSEDSSASHSLTIKSDKEVVTKEPGRIQLGSGRPIPGPSHLTTMLQSFPILFQHGRNTIDLGDLPQLVAVLKGVTTLPIATDHAPFILPTTADVTPVQEIVLDCVKITFQAVTTPNSRLRSALPNLFILMLEFVGYACRAPPAIFVDQKNSTNNTNCAAWVAQNYVPFAELSLRMVVECYGSTAHFAEVIEAGILTHIIKCFAIPLRLNYACPSQSTWKLAASYLLTTVRVGLPIARQQGKHFRSMWPELADAFEKFLFHKSEPPTPLNSEERKKHEFIDCQVVELIRSEILPFVAELPNDFVTRIIDLLNQGSINTADPNSILNGDSGQKQRIEFSRACFEALLAMSRGGPDLVRSAQKSSGSSHFGIGAISSLLGRCKQVVTKFAEDDRLSGGVPLANQQLAEMKSVLRAVVTMIGSLQNHQTRDEGHDELWQSLINLYPCLVDCVSCKDGEVRQALVETLKSYQALLRAPI